MAAWKMDPGAPGSSKGMLWALYPICHLAYTSYWHEKEAGLTRKQNLQSKDGMKALDEFEKKMVPQANQSKMKKWLLDSVSVRID